MYIAGQEEIDALTKVIRDKALFRYGVGGECDRFEARYAKYPRREAFRACRQRLAGARRGDDRRRPRAGRRGADPRPHLHGDRDLGARGRRDSGDRRRRREHHHRSAGGRGRHRPAHQGGRAGAHVGRGLRHERHHGNRRAARPDRDRGRLPGRRRRLRGQEVRLDRPHRRVQLQLLQEHDGGRGRRRLGQRRRARRAGALRDRPVSLLLARPQRRGEAVLGERRARLRADGRDAERAARPARRHDLGHARREEDDSEGHRAARQSRAPRLADEQPGPRLRDAGDVHAALGRSGDALHASSFRASSSARPAATPTPNGTRC